MASTFSQIYIQVVFAVEIKQALITRVFKEELQKYITGIIRKQGRKIIGSCPSLIGLRLSKALSDLVMMSNLIRANALDGKRLIKGKFNWQAGYDAFRIRI